jgi:hypothetical protein
MTKNSENQDPLFERLRQADPARAVPPLNEGVVARAPLAAKAKLGFGYRAWRAAIAGGGVVTASVAIVALTLSMQQQPLIKLGSTNATGAFSDSVQGATERSTGMIWNPVIYEYVAGADLSANRGRGEVYQLELVGDPRVRLAELARRFEVVGEVTRDEWSTAENPSFSINSGNSYLSIYWGGTGSWSFSRWEDYSGCEIDPGVEVDSGGSAEAGDAGEGEAPKDEEVTAPDSGEGRSVCDWSLQPTPELIPSRAEITRQALAIFGATGLETSATSLRIYRDEWGASASAALRVDGEATAIEWYVGWNSRGELSYASGHSVEPISRGQFTTISPREAVSRLGDWRWSGSVASEIYERYYAQPGLERGAVIESDPGVGFDSNDGSGQTEPAPAEKPTEDPDATIMPVYPEGELRVVTLTVNSATPALVTIYDLNGAAWLVPGYLMFNSEGFFDVVIALQDGVIELPEPFDYDIMPMPEPRMLED